MWSVPARGAFVLCSPWLTLLSWQAASNSYWQGVQRVVCLRKGIRGTVTVPRWLAGLVGRLWKPHSPGAELLSMGMAVPRN